MTLPAELRQEADKAVYAGSDPLSTVHYYYHDEATRALLHRAADALECEHLSESDKDVALAQAVEFAEYVERSAKGSMVERAKHYLSLPYSKELQKRLRATPEGD